MEPDQVRQNVGPDLDPNCLSLCITETSFLKKFDLEKNQQTIKNPGKYGLAVEWVTRFRYCVASLSSAKREMSNLDESLWTEMLNIKLNKLVDQGLHCLLLYYIILSISTETNKVKRGLQIRCCFFNFSMKANILDTQNASLN